MNVKRNKGVAILVIVLLVAQMIFGSIPANVAVAAGVTANFTVEMTANGQLYDGSKMTSDPVTIEVTSSKSIEYSTDYGFTWQLYSEPITVKDTGVHHYLFREVGTIPIETANVHIMPIPAQQAITTSPDSIYVNAAVSTSGDGKGWESAFKDLQAALAEAKQRVSSGDSVQIFVAKGIYKPSVRTGELDPRNAYFQLQNNVAIYGGFSGNGDERDIQKYLTTLSGDMGAPNDNTDNAYHVFYHPTGTNLNNTAVLDGVTITDGRANGFSYIHRNGGGMYNYNSSPELTNVTMSGNKSTNTAGTIYGGTVTIQNSIIIGNHNEPALAGTTTSTTENSLLDVVENGTTVGKLYTTGGSISTETYQPEAIFIDASKQDYRLRAKSIAIGAGDDLKNNTTTDLAGNLRKQGTIDLGAYEAFPYDVTYEANGATGNVPMDSFTYATGDTVTLKAIDSSFEKSGYTFTAWNTQADGSGTSYNAQDTFRMGAANVMLYAQWEIEDYTVNFDPNGGTAVAAQTIPYEGKIVEPPPPTKSGYTFNGWYVNNTAWDFATPITEAVTLMAQWNLNNYTVNFDPNGGTAVAAQTIPYEGKIVEPPPPTKSGYTFNGWYVNNTAWDFDTPVTEAMTLTAKWQVVSTDVGNATPTPQPVVPYPTPSVPTIMQRILENEELRYRATLVRGNVQSIITQNTDANTYAAQVVFPSEAWVEANLTATPSTLQYLVNQRTDLFIETEWATILVPHTSLNALTEALFFRIVPVQADAQQTIEENAQQNEQVQAYVGNQMTVNLFGQPVTIETNLQNQPVTITLPIPADVTAEQLQSLLVYIEHSDGTTEVKQGRIVEMEQGVKGYAFEVDHFSTFSLMYATAIEPTPEPTPEPIVLAPYIQGYPNGLFKPDIAVTRAQMATMIARFLTNGDIPTAEATFEDTQTNAAKDAIEWVKQAGLFNGTSDTTFDPNGTITRAQMAVVVARWVATTCTEEETKGYCEATSKGSSFTDMEASHWAAASIEKVSKLGIMIGNSETTFNPNGALTRAQAVKVLNQLFERPALEDISKSTFKDVPVTHWAMKEIEAAATEITVQN